MFLNAWLFIKFSRLFVRMHAIKPACYLFPGVVFAKKIMCMAENINRLNFLQAFIFVRFVFHYLGVLFGQAL